MTGKDKLRLLVYVLLIIVGAVLIALGVQAGNTGNYALFSATGGATIGASISMLLRFMLGSDIDDLRSYLLDNNRLGSEPRAAATCRGVWHLYYTSLKKSERVWIHARLDLHLDGTLGTLTTTVKKPDREDQPAQYEYTAAVRDDRLIILGKAANSEEVSSVYAFKGVTVQFFRTYCGVKLHQTWDGNTAVSPSLLSRTRLVANRGESKLLDTAYDELDRIWLEQTRSQDINVLFPNTG